VNELTTLDCLPGQAPYSRYRACLRAFPIVCCRCAWVARAAFISVMAISWPNWRLALAR